MLQEEFQYSNNQCIIQNKDVEMLGKYFDVVPDGNLLTKHGVPIFAVRMRYPGIHVITRYYMQKYKILIDVKPFTVNTNEHTMYSTDAMLIYKNEEFVKSTINFSNAKNNRFVGLIVCMINQDSRLMHAIPIIYGINANNQKCVMMMDPCYEYNDQIDPFSASIIGAKYIKEYFPDVNIFVHKTKMQADHHSCGIMACDILKNALAENGRVVKQMMSTNIQPITVECPNPLSLVLTKLHAEILKLSQIKKAYLDETSLENVSRYKIQFSEYIQNNTVNLKYYAEKTPYNPEKLLINTTETENLKPINTKLLIKGHQYAKLINTVLKNIGLEKEINPRYNSDYWIKLIKLEKDSGILRFARAILRSKREEVTQ